jgi:hypothetical protein
LQKFIFLLAGTKIETVKRKVQSVYLPGKRWRRTPTILSKELKTKLHRHTINAQANGPSAKEKQTMKSFSFLG